MIRKIQIPVTVTGSAGSATGSAQSKPVSGEVKKVYVDYGTQPATCDVTLKSLSPEETILNLVDANTNGFFYPKAVAQTNAGVAMTYNGTQNIPTDYAVDDHLVAAVAGGDAGTVTLHVWLED